MVIGVMADSHDQLGRIESAMQVFEERRIEHMLHAGDFSAPFAVKLIAAAGWPVTAVYGNNDGERVGIRKMLGDLGAVHERCAKLELGGRRIVMMHEPDLAEEAARSGMYDLVVHGHTHEAAVSRIGDAVMLNPGAAGGIPGGMATVAVVDLDRMAVETIELP